MRQNKGDVLCGSKDRSITRSVASPTRVKQSEGECVIHESVSICCKLNSLFSKSSLCFVFFEYQLSTIGDGNRACLNSGGSLVEASTKQRAEFYSMPFYQSLLKESTRLWSRENQTLVESIIDYQSLFCSQICCWRPNCGTLSTIHWLGSALYRNRGLAHVVTLLWSCINHKLIILTRNAYMKVRKESS